MTTSPLHERIRDRAAHAGIEVDSAMSDRLSTYYLLLERWNRTINLTALPLMGYPDQTIDRLIVEPLIAAQHMPDSSVRWFDLGSGGGSPAIPLKIARPEARLTMVESRERKAAFLREAARSLELSDTEVLAARIEDALPAWAGTVDVVTIRALNLDQILAPACSLLRIGGKLVLFKATNPIDFSDFRMKSLGKWPLPTEAELLILEKTG